MKPSSAATYERARRLANQSSNYFSYIFISSELGADKPDPAIFQRAVNVMHLDANEVVHVGDDPERDWKGAAAAGLSVFRLDRPKNSLRDLLKL